MSGAQEVEMGTTAIAANGRVDRNVMPAVHIYAPPATHRFVLAKTCPDCGKRTRMLGWAYEWHGATVVCLRCGREWQGGEWTPLPFMRGARQHNINEAKARWRRGSRHNDALRGDSGLIAGVPLESTVMQEDCK